MGVFSVLASGGISTTDVTSVVDTAKSAMSLLGEYPLNIAVICFVLLAVIGVIAGLRNAF